MLSHIGVFPPTFTNVQLEGVVVPISKPGFNTRFVSARTEDAKIGKVNIKKEVRIASFVTFSGLKLIFPKYIPKDCIMMVLIMIGGIVWTSHKIHGHKCENITEI
ncbi:MAG: hypothetical protein C3F06_12270 [Candidatus Methanoperedenaceae archaeon]|nr:MAG: hypothetical protein C3F06_12270 [Candidatus Methanoperedenaceae archaeon]